MTYKILASGVVQNGAQITYTPTSGSTAIVSKILVHNGGGGSTPGSYFWASIDNNGTVTSLYAGTLEYEETFEATGGIIVPNGCTLSVGGDGSSYGHYTSITIFGDES